MPCLPGQKVSEFSLLHQGILVISLGCIQQRVVGCCASERVVCCCCCCCCCCCVTCDFARFVVLKCTLRVSKHPAGTGIPFYHPIMTSWYNVTTPSILLYIGDEAFDNFLYMYCIFRSTRLPSRKKNNQQG
jgi:hypothetical protein